MLNTTLAAAVLATAAFSLPAADVPPTPAAQQNVATVATTSTTGQAENIVLFPWPRPTVPGESIVDGFYGLDNCESARALDKRAVSSCFITSPMPWLGLPRFGYRIKTGATTPSLPLPLADRSAAAGTDAATSSVDSADWTGGWPVPWPPRPFPFPGQAGPFGTKEACVAAHDKDPLARSECAPKFVGGFFGVSWYYQRAVVQTIAENPVAA